MLNKQTNIAYKCLDTMCQISYSTDIHHLIALLLSSIQGVSYEQYINTFTYCLQQPFSTPYDPAPLNTKNQTQKPLGIIDAVRIIQCHL